MLNKEIGSSFYRVHEGDIEMNTLKKHSLSLKKEKYAYYYSGRNAYLALLEEIVSSQTINKIWLPNYFCQNVINNISRNYPQVDYYEIDPFDFNKDFDFTTFAKENEIIILNNYWGLFTYNYDFKTKHRPIIIEDHSHGWLSNQCMNSKADYCICSIRKTYPIPLGGIRWSPNNKGNPGNYSSETDNEIVKAYTFIEESMCLKRKFIKNGAKINKDQYLSLLNKGEALISLSNEYISPNEKVVNEIYAFMTLNPNKIKNRNLLYINSHLENSEHFEILDRKGFTPFGLLLLFKNSKLFNAFKEEMIQHDIYPAHLWPNNDLKGKKKYLLNIHVDFRYTLDHMAHLVTCINKWIQSNPSE